MQSIIVFINTPVLSVEIIINYLNVFDSQETFLIIINV